MKTKKQFYELANELAFEKNNDKARDIWLNNGFSVISFAQVKKAYFMHINNPSIAERFSEYNNITDNDAEMKRIYDIFESTVFKESRGNRFKSAIGWENINSYLRYHSGIQYKWFKELLLTK